MSFSTVRAGLRRRLLRRLLRQAPGFFDEQFFRDNYPHSLEAGFSSIETYVRLGWRDGLKPNFLFDPEFYAKGMPKALQGRVDPAIHYLAWGRTHGHNPHPMFDLAYYRSQTGAIAEEPTGHYRLTGMKNGYNPHPLFFPTYYLGKYPDVAEAGLEPLRHYVESGAAENRRPHPVFSPSTYSRRNGGIPLGEATQHYLGKLSKPELDDLTALRPLTLRGEPQNIWEWCKANGKKLYDFPYPRAKTWTAYRTVDETGAGRMLEGELPRPYVAVIDDVLCFAGSQLLVSGTDILHDEGHQDRAVYYHPKTDAIARVSKDEFTILSVLRPEVVDEAILISTHADFNYFHMMVEFLPKFMMLEEIGVPNQIPVLIQANLHPNIREGLNRVVGTRPVLEYPVGCGLKVKKLWYASDLSRVLDNLYSPVIPNYDIVINPLSVRFIAKRILGDNPRPAATRKYYFGTCLRLPVAR